MLASRFPFHYGWIIVLAGICSLFSCLGLARFAYGMLLPSMGKGLLLGYDQMGFVSTANFAGYFVSVGLTPWIIRHLRPRLTITLGLLMVAASMLGIAACSGFASLAALYAVTGIGSGLANIPIMVLVSHWFRRSHRGRAAGLMVVGNGAGIIFSGIFVPFMNRQFGPQGWRWEWLILGLLSLAAAVLVAALVRNDPADLGLEPVGVSEPVLPVIKAAKGRNSGASIVLHLGALYAIFGATYMVYGSFIVTTMVDEYGFAESSAGMFWSCIGFFGLFSGVLFGVLSDRIGRKGGLMTVFAVQSCAYALAGSGLGATALILSVFLYGIVAFSIPTIMAAAVGDYMGTSRAAAAFSMVTLFFAVGQTVGPATAGIIADASGSFTSSFLACAGLTALAVVLAALLPVAQEGA